MTADLALALVESLDDDALDRLAERLAPRLADRVGAVEDRWMGAKEAAEHLGVSLDGLHRLTAARRVPFEQDAPGCKLWFRRSELDAWRASGGGRNASTALPASRDPAQRPRLRAAT